MIREVIARLPRPARPTRRVRRGRRLLGAVPGRDHLPDARRARGRPPADPPLARPHAAPRARRDGADARGRRRAMLEHRSATSTSSPPRSGRNPGDDMLTRLTQVDGRPRRRRGDRPRRRRDRRVRHAPRRRRRRDGHEARRQRGRAVRPPPRPVAEGLDDPSEIPRRGRGDPPLPAAVAVPGPVLGRRTATFDGGTIPAGFPVLLITGAATRDDRAFDEPDDFDIERPAGVSHRLRPRRAQLPRRRARPDGEPHRDRGASPSAGPARGRRDGLRRVHMSNVAGYSNVPLSVA